MHRRSLRTDERAVDGMPIRLLVALTVGIATFSLLVPLPTEVADADTAELTVELDGTQLRPGEEVTIAVVTEDGEPVEGATVLVRGRSLPVKDDPLRFETGKHSHRVTIEIAHGGRGDVQAGFRPTQRRGTISFDVRPPTDEYTDARQNPEVTVIRRATGGSIP